jgi:hypothetical protein
VAPAEAVRASKRPEHYNRLRSVERLTIRCVEDPDGRLHLYGGLHSLVAVLRRHGTTIEAIVHPGTESDAYALALRENQSHGLSRSPEDEDAVLWTAFTQFPSWSIDRVSRWCGIDRDRVRQAHAEMVADGMLSPSPVGEVADTEDEHLQKIASDDDRRSAQTAINRVLASVDDGKIDEVAALTKMASEAMQRLPGIAELVNTIGEYTGKEAQATEIVERLQSTLDGMYEAFGVSRPAQYKKHARRGTGCRVQVA